MSVYGFDSEQAVRRVAAATRWAEEASRSGARSGSASGESAPAFALVEITGAIAGGLYPAKLAVWDDAAAEWRLTDQEARYKDANGASVAVGVRVMARFVGPVAAGGYGLYVGSASGAEWRFVKCVDYTPGANDGVTYPDATGRYFQGVLLDPVVSSDASEPWAEGESVWLSIGSPNQSLSHAEAAACKGQVYLCLVVGSFTPYTISGGASPAERRRAFALQYNSLEWCQCTSSTPNSAGHFPGNVLRQFNSPGYEGTGDVIECLLARPAYSTGVLSTNGRHLGVFVGLDYYTGKPLYTVLPWQPASATCDGYIDTTSQSIKGPKNFLDPTLGVSFTGTSGISSGTDVVAAAKVTAGTVFRCVADGITKNTIANQFGISGGIIIAQYGATGDIAYFDGTNWVRLAYVSNSKILGGSGGVPAWVDPPAAGIASIGSSPTSLTGFIVGNGTNTLARSIAVGSSKLSISNGNGVSGDATLDVVEANLSLGNIGGTLGISNGGTGQTTANAALNALLPTQTSNSGKFLATDGTDSSWADVTGVPVGTVVPFAGITVPSGWLLCDGSAVSRTTYATLFATLTTTRTANAYTSSPTQDNCSTTVGLWVGLVYDGPGFASGATIATIASGTVFTSSTTSTSNHTGATYTFYPHGRGNGTTTFNVPDLRRRVPVGSGGSGTATLGAKLGQTGGSETHTLATTEIPSHTHQASSNAGQFPAFQGGGTGTNAYPGAGTNAINTGPNTRSAGGGGAHNNLQPSVVMNYIIKT